MISRATKPGDSILASDSVTGSHSKTVLRAEFRNKRREFLESHRSSRAQVEGRIIENLRRVIGNFGGLWAGFRSQAQEPETWPLHSLTAATHQWAFPRVTGNQMEFWCPRESSNTSGGWSQNSWKIWEPLPESSRKVEVSDFKGVLVPGLIFDRLGGRLGSGAGFYDRALQGFTGLRVGVTFSSQIFDGALPQEPHDIQLDFIVTENEVIQIKKGQS